MEGKPEPVEANVNSLTQGRRDEVITIGAVAANRTSRHPLPFSMPLHLNDSARREREQR